MAKKIDKGVFDKLEKELGQVQDVWFDYIMYLMERDESLYLFKLNGVTASIREEILMSGQSRDISMHRYITNQISGTQEFKDWALKEFKPYEQMWEMKREGDVRLSDTYGITLFDYGETVIRQLLGRDKVLDAKLISYCLIPIAGMTSEFDNYRIRQSMTGAFQDTIGYWLMHKGIMEDTHVSAVKVRYHFPEMIKYIKNELVGTDYAERMLIYGAEKGQKYAEMKVGRNTLTGYIFSVNWDNSSIALHNTVEMDQYLTDIVGSQNLEDMKKEMENAEKLKKFITKMANRNTFYYRKFSEYYNRANYMNKEIGKLSVKLSKLEDKTESDSKTIEAMREREKLLKKNIKGKDAEISEFKRVEKELIKEISKIKDLKSSGVKDIKPYEVKIKKMETELEERVKRLQEKNREYGKVKSELDRLGEKYENLKGENEDLVRSLEVQEERKRELIEEGTEMEIPVSTLIEPIKGKRIAIVGGDSMHALIRELGFEDIRFVKANEIIRQNALTSCDLVVYITNEMPHSLYYQGQSMIEGKDIKVLRYNHRTIPRLCQEIFITLFS